MKTNVKVTRRERADFKRLTELCNGNREWLKEFIQSPGEWLKSRNLQLNPKLALEAVKITVCREQGVNPYIEAYQEIVQHIYQYVENKTYVDRMLHPKFKAWYQRQISRNRFQSSVSRHMSGMFYAPVSFELSDGCSIGCDFCCLAAKPLESLFRYQPDHDLMWRNVLTESKEIIGDIADFSICYFATEPFDNPEYEEFLKSYYDIFHCYPQTTTAASTRNIERTKRFLSMIGEKELALAAVRFSVTSLEDLEEIHRSFSSEELEYVELLLNNPESFNGYSKSGRSVQLSESMKDKMFLDSGSSICTNGFVVNMSKRTITLVSPHRPDSHHSLGMKVYEKCSFADTEDYGRVLQEMINRWMPIGLPEDKPLFLADCLAVTYSGYQMKVSGDGVSRTITLSDKEQQCLHQILEKQIPPQELYRDMYLTEYERERFRKKIEILYDAGYLEENKI